MPNVEVKDANGNLLRTYEIIVGGYGTLVTDEHVIDMAKQNAVEDELVDDDAVETLSFHVVGVGRPA